MKAEPMECEQEHDESDETSSVESETTAASLKAKTPYFKFTNMIKEDHGQPLYGAQFNHCLKKEDPLIFATVGSRVTIYECLNDGTIKLLQCYADPDPKEDFYTCTWSYMRDTGDPILAAGGFRGVIRVFSPMTMACITSIQAHAIAINDLKFHPKLAHLILSASKDRSLRLWNVQTEACIVMFFGDMGHRDEVLSCDFNTLGSKVISSGMDHSLKLWDLHTDKLRDAIDRSYMFDKKRYRRSFTTVKEQYPVFSTRAIHGNYIDCCRWFGDFILSKSCQNEIVCWKPGSLEDHELKPGEEHASVIHRFPLQNCNLWFMRFSMDFMQKYLALGNQQGKTYVWDLESNDPTKIQHSVLQHRKCNSTIRQTSFSRDGQVLICVCDDGTVWRWDKNI